MKKTAISLLIIAIAISIAFYVISTKPKPKKSEIKEQIWSVKAQTVNKTSYRPELNLYGTVESSNNSIITSVITADVNLVLALEGQFVEKGQTIISLNPKNINLLLKQRQAEVDDIQEKLSKNLRELTRQESLYKKRVVSLSSIEAIRQTVASLRAQLNSSQARLEQTKTDKSRSEVVAPFSGRIVKVFVSMGDRVNIGSKLVAIYDSNNLEVRTQLPNRYLGAIRKIWSEGKPITALINGKTKAELSRITGEVKAKSAGIEALFKLEKYDNNLSIGRAVNIKVYLPEVNDAFAIPYDAIYDRNKIYKIVDSRLKSSKIKQLGQYTINDNLYAIVDGQIFQNNELLLLTQLPNAINELKVKIVFLDGKSTYDQGTTSTEDK